MTIDKPALKALAEAAAGEWYGIGELRYEDRRTGDLHGLHHDDERFIAAANPATILALLAEIERFERNRDMWKAQVERQAEELTSLRAEVADWKDTLKFNEGCWSKERATMIDKIQAERADNEALRKDAERNNRMLLAACLTIGEICEALGIDNHSEPDMIVEAVRWLNATGDGLNLRCERPEADKKAMAETHTLYTWLRKKCDQPSSDVVAVHMNIGHDWVTVRDLDKDLRALIDAEEP